MESTKRLNEKRFGDYLTQCLINRLAEQPRWSIRALTAELLVQVDMEFFINEILKEFESKKILTVYDNTAVEVEPKAFSNFLFEWNESQKKKE